MKKTFILLLCITLLVGCGKKEIENPTPPSNEEKPVETTLQLTCKSVSDSDGLKNNTTATTNFNEDKSNVLSSTTITILNLSKNLESMFNEIKTSMNDSYVALKGLSGITLENSDNEINQITNKMIIDYTKLDAQGKEALGLTNDTESYEQSKAEYEKLGYTCE